MTRSASAAPCRGGGGNLEWRSSHLRDVRSLELGYPKPMQCLSRAKGPGRLGPQPPRKTRDGQPSAPRMEESQSREGSGAETSTTLRSWFSRLGSAPRRTRGTMRYLQNSHGRLCRPLSQDGAGSRHPLPLLQHRAVTSRMSLSDSEPPPSTSLHTQTCMSCKTA